MIVTKIKKAIYALADRWVPLRNLLIKLVKLKRSLKFLYFYLRKKPLLDNVIMLEAFGGRSYGCNPKALYTELVENPRYKDYIKIWSFRKPEEFKYLENNENTRVIKYRSREYYRYYSRAKYWISNYRLPQEIRKRPDQLFLQTWHGVPLKKLGYDIKDYQAVTVTTKQLQEEYTKAALMYTYIVSPSRYYTEKLTSAYNLKAIHKEDIFIEAGYPRNDHLYKYTEEELKKIREDLMLPSYKKIILYCPTYRDNQYKLGQGNTYELGIDFERLKEELSGEYVVLFRTHYLISSAFNFNGYEGFLIDVSSYQDINDLYMVSDMLITDYSSVMFDYGILKKPMIFYMYDLEDYKNNLRDFYLDIEELPGPIALNQPELIKAIRDQGNSFIYDEKYKEFNKKHNYLNGPETSEVILNKFITNYGGRRL